MKTKLLSLFVLFCFPVISFAQEVIMSGEALYNTNFSLINGSIMGAAIKAKSGTKTAAKKATLRSLEFTRSESLSKTIQQDYISRLAKEQPNMKPALEKAFSGNKLRNQFDQLLSTYNYSGTNLADAMTAYLVISWQVVHGQEFNDRRGFDAVRKMIRENLLSGTTLNAVTDKEKQTATETFGYQAIIAMNTYKTLRNNRNKTALDQFKAAVDRSAKESGIDLKGVRLTSNGFVKL